MSDSRFPWRTLLFVSVALNLLVVGAVAGAWSAGMPNRDAFDVTVDAVWRHGAAADHHVAAGHPGPLCASALIDAMARDPR